MTNAIGFAIEKHEPVSVAMPRIVTERIDLALEHLLDEKESPAERIHNARKRFKECRAATRLIRFALGDAFEIENAWYRDAGRRLAALRDADAVLEAADELVEVARTFHDRRLLRRLRRRLANRQRRASRSDLAARIDETVRELPAAKARVAVWPPLPDDFSAIGPGFRRTYRDGRRACKAAQKSPSPETFHDWRKRVKDHWYHVQILRETWPELMKPYRSEVESLSDALGDRHDLDVLRQVIVERGDFGTDFELGVMHAMIDRRVSELTKAATETGSRIYAESPKVVHDRFEAQWEIWRK